jgi:hypothetical protein
MAVGGQLPVMRAVGMAYRDVYRALLSMPAVFLVVVIVVVSVSFLHIFVLEGVLAIPILGQVVAFLVGAVQSFFQTPLLIAVHRFILIDEVTPRYVLEPQAPRFMRFFAWTIALSLLGTGANVVHQILILIGLWQSVTYAVLAIFIVIIVFIGLRLTVLFPAIAVDAPGATAANAFADTKGHVLGIFLIWLVALVPLAAMMVVTAVTAALLRVAGTEAKLIFTIVTAIVVSVIALPLFVAIASRIFQALADQVLVGTPAQPG